MRHSSPCERYNLNRRSILLINIGDLRLEPTIVKRPYTLHSIRRRQWCLYEACASALDGQQLICPTHSPPRDPG